MPTQHTYAHHARTPSPRVDKPALDAIGRTLATKLGAGDAPADAAAAVWAFATLNAKPDAQVRAAARLQGTAGS